MATPTYTAIASITLGSSASSVTFSSIPQDYRDLVLVVTGEGSSATSFYALYFNADTGANYSRVEMSGTGSGTSSSSPSNLVPITHNATSESTTILQIMDYSATDKHKTVLYRNNSVDYPIVKAGAGRWASTSAVTSLEVEGTSGVTLTAGSTLALWGIAS